MGWFDRSADRSGNADSGGESVLGDMENTVEKKAADASAAAAAVRRIAGQDLLMLYEKVTGKAVTQSPDALSNEQDAANTLEQKVDGGRSGEGSAYAKPGAAPTLPRPVLMIPGLTMAAASFDPLAEQLASDPTNGEAAVYVAADKQFHQGNVDGAVMTPEQLKTTHLFILQDTDPNAAPSDKEPQVAAAMSAVQEATGAGMVDVVTHSAGGTDFRLYLEERGKDEGPEIGNAVMIGPASHGTEMGNLGAAVGGPMGVQKAGKELAVGSPLIDMLNKNWDQQRGQIHGDITIIAVSGAPTPSQHGITDGDGYMPVDQAAMPGADTVVLRGLDPTAIAHLREVEYSGVIGAVEDGLKKNSLEPKP